MTYRVGGLPTWRDWRRHQRRESSRCLCARHNSHQDKTSRDKSWQPGSKVARKRRIRSAPGHRSGRTNQVWCTVPTRSTRRQCQAASACPCRRAINRPTRWTRSRLCSQVVSSHCSVQSNRTMCQTRVNWRRWHESREIQIRPWLIGKIKSIKIKLTLCWFSIG